MTNPPLRPPENHSSRDDDCGDTDATRRAALSPILSAGDFRPLSSVVRVEFAARSHRGVSRPINEDHYLVVRLVRGQETVATSLTGRDVPPQFEECAYAMLVADGLGEGGSGSVASRVALSTFAHLALHYGKWNVRLDSSAAEEIIERAEWFYSKAHAAIRAQTHTSQVLTGMATALTAAYTVGDELFVAHVGHSRAYLLREGELTLLTRDHTLDRQRSETQRPAAVETRAQDLRHILTEAVGAPGAVPTVEIERFLLRDHDLLLLCTNGLTDMLDDDRIAEILALRRSLEEQCDILIDLAMRQGGTDNITVVIAAYQVPQT